MKSAKRSVLCISVLSALTVTGCGSKIPGLPKNWDEGVVWTSEGETVYNSLSGLKRDSTYRAYETYFPQTLNTAVTMQQEDSQIIANFIDGLVEVNRYGRIVPDIAESWKPNDDSSEYVFTIRSGVKWVTNDGDPYKINGEQVYVTAQDFVKGAMENLKFANQSNSSYLLTMFIDGASEYNNYTRLEYYKAIGGGKISQTKLGDTAPSDSEEAKVWTTCSANVGRIVTPSSSCGKYIDPLTDTDIATSLRVNVSDLPNIANFSRVGVKANGNKLTYTLTGTAPYFLSALTYTPFLPIQTEFYEKVGASNYGSSRDNILANGAFVLSYFPGTTATQLVMNKNMEYFDAKNVKIGRIELYRLVSDVTASTGREGFESGAVDSFTVNFRDTVGWSKYVTGGAEGSGTINAPANAQAFSNESDGNGSTFDFALNTQRDPYQAGGTVSGSIFDTYKYDSEVPVDLHAVDDGKNVQIMNTNRALKLKSVRKLILSSLDYPTYLLSNGSDPYEQIKETVNTYTPHDFVAVEGTDTSSVQSPDYNDYIKAEYIDSVLGGERTPENWAKAEEVFGYGHIGGIGVANKVVSEQTPADHTAWAGEYKKMYEDAIAEINSYNDVPGNTDITLPIIVEYTGLAYSDESDNFDRHFINQTNANINGCWVPGDSPEVSQGRLPSATTCPTSGSATGYGNKEVVRLVKNTRDNIPESDDYSLLTYYGATQLFVTGWGPDYSDPLTFAWTVVKGGDLCDYFGVCENADEAIDAQVDAIIGTYTNLVKDAMAETDSVERAELFAKAEVELLTNTYIMRPLYIRGQGVNVGVSRTIPYRVPRVVYGICSNKYKWLEKLADGVMLTQAQRDALKAEYEDLRNKDLAQ